jgi:hypothetical protein
VYDFRNVLSNTVKPKAHLNTVFKNSALASKKTQHICINGITWLMLFEEIITVCPENYTKHVNTLCGQIQSW